MDPQNQAASQVPPQVPPQAPTPLPPTVEPTQPMNIAPSPFTPTTPTVPDVGSVNKDGNSHKKVGPIIAIFVIIVAIIILATYMFASTANKQQQAPIDNSAIAAQETANAGGSMTDTQVSQSPETVQPITNTNDDIQSLQNDLNNSTTGVDSQNF